MNDKHYKYPRLYGEEFQASGASALSSGQVNYLRNVLRLGPGDMIRAFNGRDGEWLAEIVDLSKKGGTVEARENIRQQGGHGRAVHLLFAPLKKKRMDFVIEKCTELGVTDFHPIVTNRTEVRSLKTDRVQAQIIEACEQSERLSVPRLHDVVALDRKIAAWKETAHIIGCVERADAPHLSDLQDQDDMAFLIGPVGGFDDGEREILLQNAKIQPVSLGDQVLRAETASMMCVTFALLHHKKQ